MEGQEGPGSSSAGPAAAGTDAAGPSGDAEADGLWVPDEYVEVRQSPPGSQMPLKTITTP